MVLVEKDIEGGKEGWKGGGGGCSSVISDRPIEWPSLLMLILPSVSQPSVTAQKDLGRPFTNLPLA